jgi:PAS domain S-box-containing protein
MTKRSLFTIGSLLFFLHSGLLFCPVQADAAGQQVKIGVLAHRGADTALKMWGPTADYLTRSIPHYTFSIVPLSFHDVGPAVGRGDVDFVLANSSIYVELETRYSVNRIATLQNNGWQGGHTVFGGVIFCRADRNDIRSLNDLKGKSFLAVDETSLGGWQVAWRELKNSGLDPYRDFSSLQFAGTTHDAVVYAVRDGKVDAGTVRTDTLERMAAEEKIDIRAFRILNQQQEKGFPFLLSTRLYPEWPLAKVKHTGDELAKITIDALLHLRADSPAAKAGKITGWTIPLDYHPVHDLMKELRLGPYRDYGKITFSDVLRLYWRWIALALAVLLFMIVLTLHVLRLNKRLVLSRQLVEEARNGLEQEVRVRTADLKTANEELIREVAERRKIEDELRLAKEEWERTFDAITDPVMLLDTNYHIIKANKAMADALGVPPAKAVGMTCYESVHGTEAPPDYCPHAKLLTDGQARSQEILEPRLGGHYLITVSPLHAPDGTLIGSIHAARDISFLMKAEELSKKYSRDLERLLSISRETTMTTDLKVLYRTFVCASREILNLDFSSLMLLSEDKRTLTGHDSLGFPEAMIGRFSLVEGQGLSTLVVKDKKPETVADFISETRFEIPPIVHEKGIRSAVAVPMMMKDDIIGVLIGHTLECRVFSQSEIDIYQMIANQAAVAIRSAMNADILKKSEKYIRDITASLGEGVYVLNANGETTFMNPEAEALLGWSEKELIHKNIHDIVHNRRADGTTLLFDDCEMRKVIETGNRFYSTEELFIHKDGTIFPVAVHSRPLMENGKVVASVTAFRDITERKLIEQEREKLIADLQKALADIRTLHGIVPICASCKKIRDDEGAWHQMEAYISEHTDAQFSHGICKECAKKLYPQFYKEEEPPAKG